MNYSWPGNIRELENVMERINILADGQEIYPTDLPHYINENYSARAEEIQQETKPEPKQEEKQEEEPQGMKTWEEYEKEIIAQALKEYGSYNAAGKALGLTHKTVAAKARKYGLDGG